MTVRARKIRITTAAIAVTVGLSGCSVGLQDLPLGAGGRNSFDVTAELITADGLVSGADVRHGQQIVGRVTDMRLEERHAEITMTIADGTDLPANTTLNVELPSALGTPFVRLSEPADPQGRLTEGSHLSLSDTGVGPQIESTLAALGNILGGSGVSQLQSVMSSLNTAFENRSDKVGDLIDTLNRLLARSSRYTDDFNAAMAAAADVSELLVAQQQTVDDFLGQVPQAVTVLAAQRDQIAKLMSQTTRLATNVAAITRGRQETLDHLVGDAEQMVKSLSAFNTEVGSTLDNMNAFMTNFDRAIPGDYLVFDGSLDIPGGIDKILTGGVLLAGQPLPTPDDLRNVLSGGLANKRPEKKAAKKAAPATKTPTQDDPSDTQPTPRSPAMTTKAKTRRLRMPRVRMPQARTGMLQFLIFLALSAIVIPYGINFIAGPEGFGDKIVLTARMDDAFGLSSGTGVTLRGVDIGTVRSVELDPAGGAADIELVVRGDTRIPADSFMQVTMASMAGIQSVDIIPPDNNPPYLESGDTIAAPADKQPKQMDAIIGDAASVLRSIGSGNLTTLGNEFYAAFDHDEKALAGIVSNGTALAGLVNRNAPILQGLFDEWLQVLSAMNDTTTAFEAGMRSAATFTDQLDANQPVFVYLLDKSPESLTRTQALFDKYRGTFGGVMANLAVVEPIISDRDQSLAVGLETIPQGLLDLRSIVKNGRADFALIGTQGPVCMFYDQPRYPVGDLNTPAPNLARFCPAGNGYGQRGAVNAPRPNDLGTSTWTSPGGVSGPPAVADPLLIPNGVELLQWWHELLERARNGN